MFSLLCSDEPTRLCWTLGGLSDSLTSITIADYSGPPRASSPPAQLPLPSLKPQRMCGTYAACSLRLEGVCASSPPLTFETRIVNPPLLWGWGVCWLERREGVHVLSHEYVPGKTEKNINWQKPTHFSLLHASLICFFALFIYFFSTALFSWLFGVRDETRDAQLCSSCAFNICLPFPCSPASSHSHLSSFLLSLRYDLWILFQRSVVFILFIHSVQSADMSFAFLFCLQQPLIFSS